MGLREVLQDRRDRRDLGRGIWWQAYRRCGRAVDRFYQVLCSLELGPACQGLGQLAQELADLLGTVRQLAASGQRLAPSSSSDLPALGPGLSLHRLLSQLGTALASAAQALLLASCPGSCQGHCPRLQAVEQRFIRIRLLLKEAQALDLEQ
ncbi:MAG: dehydrogenase [Rothia sp. (in: high G+C Gram-positive bacteria)]|nr:dehydrogenase [Rothia sp. (in: high G+C Gram-positive bacteria)]